MLPSNPMVIEDGNRHWIAIEHGFQHLIFLIPMYLSTNSYVTFEINPLNIGAKLKISCSSTAPAQFHCKSC